MKKILFFFMAMMAFVGVKAEDAVYQTLTFSADTNQQKVSSYTATWQVVVDEFTWDIANFNNNNNSWAYVKCGRKNNESVATITTGAAIDKAVTKVVLTIDAITTAKVNSITLLTSETNDFTTPIESVEIEMTAGEQTAALATPAENLYYQLVFDCASGSSNGLVTVSKVEYYTAPAAGEIVVAKPEASVVGGVYEEAQTVELTAEEGATIMYSVNGGEAQEYTEAIAVSETATIEAWAEKEGVESKHITLNYVIVVDVNVATALQMIADGKGQEAYVTGYIVSIAEVSTQYGNATYVIADDADATEGLTVFRGLSLDGEKFVAEDEIGVGDKVKVYGKLIAYTKDDTVTPEVASGNKIVSIEKAAVVPAVATLEVGTEYNEDYTQCTIVVTPTKEGTMLYWTDEENGEPMGMLNGDEPQPVVAYTPGRGEEAGTQVWQIYVYEVEFDEEGNMTTVAMGYEQVNLVAPKAKLELATAYNEDNSTCVVTATPTQEGTQMVLSIDGGEEFMELPAEGYTIAWTPGVADENGICVFNVVVREIKVTYDEELEMDVIETIIEGSEQVHLSKPIDIAPVAGDSEENPIVLAEAWTTIARDEVGMDEANATYFSYTAERAGQFVFSCNPGKIANCTLPEFEGYMGMGTGYGKVVAKGETVVFSAILPAVYAGAEEGDEELYDVTEYNINVEILPVAVVVPEKPAAPAFSELVADNETIYYLYNTEAGAFFMSANEWSTRASVSESYGFEFKIEANDGKYILHDNVQAIEGNNGERRLGWKVVFAESATSIYVDRGSQPNWDNWTITPLGNNTYTIGNEAVAGLLGLNAGQDIVSDSRLYFVENGATTWAFVSKADYDQYMEAAAEALEAIATYNKLQAAKEHIYAMATELNSTNVYTAEAKAAFDEKYPVNAWVEAADYNTLTIEDANAAEKVYKANFAVTGWHAANDIDDLLTSAWEGADGNFGGKYYINTWSTEGEGDGSEFKVPFFEYWTGDGNSLEANTMTATVTGLEPGAVYSVSSWTRTRIKNGAEAPVYGITFKVGDGEAVDACVGERVGNGPMYLAYITAEGAADAEGKLTISYTVADNNISWLSWKNVYYTKVYDSQMEADLAFLEAKAEELTNATRGNEEYLTAATYEEYVALFNELNVELPTAIDAAAQAVEAGEAYVSPVMKSLLNSRVADIIASIAAVKAGETPVYALRGIVGTSNDVMATPFEGTVATVESYVAVPEAPGTKLVVIKNWDGTNTSDLKVYYTSLSAGLDGEEQISITGIEQIAENGEVISELNDEGEEPAVVVYPKSAEYPMVTFMLGVDEEIGEPYARIQLDGESGQIALYGMFQPASQVGGVEDNMGVAEAMASMYMITWSPDINAYAAIKEQIAQVEDAIEAYETTVAGMMYAGRYEGEELTGAVDAARTWVAETTAAINAKYSAGELSLEADGVAEEAYAQAANVYEAINNAAMYDINVYGQALTNYWLNEDDEEYPLGVLYQLMGVELTEEQQAEVMAINEAYNAFAEAVQVYTAYDEETHAWFVEQYNDLVARIAVLAEAIPEPEPLYEIADLTVGECEGYGDPCFTQEAKVSVVAYTEDSFIIRAFDGIEGHDITVVFDEEENVVSINDVESGYTEWIGNFCFYVGEGYGYATGNAVEGYALLYCYIGEEWGYYYINWENYGDGIASVVKMENGAVYNLSGQKVEKPVKGGIYIVNGKKVVLK